MADKEYIERGALIELLKGAETKVTEILSAPLALEEWLAIYADHLIENDAVIVVRCKDCKHWDKNEGECSHWYGFREDDFCSYGERKEQK